MTNYINSADKKEKKEGKKTELLYFCSIVKMSGFDSAAAPLTFENIELIHRKDEANEFDLFLAWNDSEYKFRYLGIAGDEFD